MKRVKIDGCMEVKKGQRAKILVGNQWLLTSPVTDYIIAGGKALIYTKSGSVYFT